MFSSSFTMSEQKHRQWTPYKHAAPGSQSEHDTHPLDQQDCISGTFCIFPSSGMACCALLCFIIAQLFSAWPLQVEEEDGENDLFQSLTASKQERRKHQYGFSILVGRAEVLSPS